MDFYDIVLEGCMLPAGQEKSLGFKKIFVAGKDVRLVSAEKNGDFKDAIVSSSDKKRLVDAARGGAAALIVEDMRIDRKLLETMADKGTILCMPLSRIVMREGTDRAATVFLMRGLYDSAKKRGIHVGFASMAPSALEMCSSMQLIGLARLAGADEQYARYSLGAVNMEMVKNED